MTPFTRHRGIAAPLLRINIDTDAIIPSREMKTIGKTGLAAGLFAGWRYTAPGGREPDPGFVLNQPAYRGASILLAGANFGCGSSREHAVWALAEFGIRCVIAPSFGTIFFDNCVRNGVLPVVLDERAIAALAGQVERDPAGAPLDVDLVRNVVAAPDGTEHPFALDPASRTMLLEGLDPIGVTLQLLPQIEAHVARDRLERPWIYSKHTP